MGRIGIAFGLLAAVLVNSTSDFYSNTRATYQDLAPPEKLYYHRAAPRLASEARRTQAHANEVFHKLMLRVRDPQSQPEPIVLNQVSSSLSAKTSVGAHGDFTFAIDRILGRMERLATYFERKDTINIEMVDGIFGLRTGQETSGKVATVTALDPKIRHRAEAVSSRLNAAARNSVTSARQNNIKYYKHFKPMIMHPVGIAEFRERTLPIRRNRAVGILKTKIPESKSDACLQMLMGTGKRPKCDGDPELD